VVATRIDSRQEGQCWRPARQMPTDLTDAALPHLDPLSAKFQFFFDRCVRAHTARIRGVAVIPLAPGREA